MRTLIFPHINSDDVAKCLKLSEKQAEIWWCKTFLVTDVTKRRDVWIGYEQAIAFHGLILCRSLGIDPGFFVARYSVTRENLKWPPWLGDYTINHRKFLCLMGWIKYFQNRGYSNEKAKELELQPIMLMIKENKDLEEKFKFLDERLNQFGFKHEERDYAELGPPEACSLYPRNLLVT